MSKRHVDVDTTLDENPPKRRKRSADEVLVEAAKKGDTTAVRAGLDKLSADTDNKTVVLDAVHEACRGNHDECLALLLPYVETTQMGFGNLLSECVHADHVACTEVLLQHWKSVCSNVAMVPHGQEDTEGRACPAMWADPAVCQVLIDAGADIETKDGIGRPPLHWACRSGALAVVKLLVTAGAGVRVTDNNGNTCLLCASYEGHTETVRYLVGLKKQGKPQVDVNLKCNDGWSALVSAVRQKHADVVEVLIDAGADIEGKVHDGRLPLHIASCGANVQIVKLLVKAGAGVRATNEGTTCLMLAAYCGHAETVRYLVGLPQMDVNHKDIDGCVALHCAADEKHADVVDVLIDAGADIEIKDDTGSSPLHVACRSGALAVVKLLVKAGAGVRGTDNDGNACLLCASAQGHTETVRYLVGLPEVDLSHKVNDGCVALHCAADLQRADVVDVLIDAGADIEIKDDMGRSPLHWACRSGALDVVKLLVKAGAGVRATDNDGNTCLMCASSEGHTETVRYLVGLPEVDLSHKVNDGWSALHCAADLKHADVVKVLIDAGADIEIKDDTGHSLLHWACRSGALDVVKLLAKAGAGVRVTDNQGHTCLMCASAQGHTDTVHYLVGLPQVDLSHKDNNGCTALHHAGDQNHADVVKVLIDAGADIEAKDDMGRPPLHWACRSGALDVVKMLVKSGAGVRVTDNDGNTCLMWASKNGHTETVRYLVGLPEVDVNHRNLLGHTALDYARVEQHADVVQVLLEHRGEVFAQ